jgi:hypothetical protein
LAKHGGNGRALEKLAGKAAADAVAHVEELADAKMVHQPELSSAKAPHGSQVGIGPVSRRHWRAVAHRDAAEVVS